jgi:antirestriction protein ArdC
LGNVKAPLGMPKNAATGRVYSGVNVLIVWIDCIERGFGTRHSGTSLRATSQIRVEPRLHTPDYRR